MTSLRGPFSSDGSHTLFGIVVVEVKVDLLRIWTKCDPTPILPRGEHEEAGPRSPPVVTSTPTISPCFQLPTKWLVTWLTTVKSRIRIRITTFI